MTAAEIEREIRRICERLTAINKDMPDMTGMDWASDHGWISQDEWQAAEDKAKEGISLQEAEVEKIEALRRAHPRAMDEFLGEHIERLKGIRDGLEQLSRTARDKKLEFAMRFNLTLLPDIISCLKAWRGKMEPKHGIAWAWRVGFSVSDESEKFIAREMR
jgi:hypothetical protein